MAPATPFPGQVYIMCIMRGVENVVDRAMGQGYRMIGAADDGVSDGGVAERWSLLASRIGSGEVLRPD